MSKWTSDATGIECLDFPDGSGFVAVERASSFTHRGMALYWVYTSKPRRNKFGTVPDYEAIGVYANKADAMTAGSEWYSQNIGAVE